MASSLENFIEKPKIPRNLQSAKSCLQSAYFLLTSHEDSKKLDEEINSIEDFNKKLEYISTKILEKIWSIQLKD